MANPEAEVVVKQEKEDISDPPNDNDDNQKQPDSATPVTNGVEVKQERDATTPVTTTGFADGEQVGPPEPQVFGQPTQDAPVRVKQEPMDETPPANPPTDKQSTINMINAFTAQMATVKQEPQLADDTVQEVEDVPEGFFDDFMTDDFMEGLNVIDEDDEEESKAAVMRKKKIQQEKQARGTKIKSEEAERQRRDPEKTRRDIQRDKARCAQDKQKKMIKERLSVVETGLVPPGMEMEVELPRVQEEDPKKESRKRRSRSAESKVSSRRRSRSSSQTRRHQSRSSAADSRRSPSLVRRFKRSPDSLRASGRSPKRSPSSRRAHRKSPSPRRRPRRSRSRSRDRYRSRSRSPRRRNKQKPTFLEQLAVELNKTSSTTHVTPAAAVMNSAGMAYPPTPAFYPLQPPAPVMQPAQPMFECYDENYFLNGGVAGVSGMMMVDGMGMVGGGGYMVPQPVPAPVPPPVQFPLPVATPQPLSYGMMPQVAMEPVASTSAARQQKPTPVQQQPQQPAPSNEDLTKLLAEKKISLSDFLSLTAKNEARPATTYNWQEKIKVLSRIQEAIDYLSGSRLYEGRLKVRKVHQKPKPVNDESPITRNPSVYLPFSSIDANQKANFAISFTDKVNNLLRFLDINLKFKNTSPSKNPDGTTRRRGVRKRGHAAGTHRRPATSGTSTFQKMTQTDRMTCEECDKRKEVRKVSIGVQCGTNITHDEGTQFPDPNEDFPRRSSSSLATMTPAQLLRQAADRVSSDERMRDDRMIGRADRDVWVRQERMIGGRTAATAAYNNDFDMEESYLNRGPYTNFAGPSMASNTRFPASGVRARMPSQMRPAAPPPRYGGFTRF